MIFPAPRTLGELDQTEYTCDCDACKGMCLVRSCWPTPDEARRLIAQGWGDHLQADSWEGDECQTVWVLCPAARGYEGKLAPSYGWGQSPHPHACTLLTRNQMCPLHDLGLKPLEGRLAIHRGVRQQNPHGAIARSWETPEAQELVVEWMKVHGLDQRDTRCLRCGGLKPGGDDLCNPCDAALNATIDAYRPGVAEEPVHA